MIKHINNKKKEIEKENEINNRPKVECHLTTPMDSSFYNAIKRLYGIPKDFDGRCKTCSSQLCIHAKWPTELTKNETFCIE